MNRQIDNNQLEYSVTIALGTRQILLSALREQEEISPQVILSIISGEAIIDTIRWSPAQFQALLAEIGPSFLEALGL